MLENQQENEDALLDLYDNHLGKYNDTIASQIRFAVVWDLKKREYKPTPNEEARREREVIRIEQANLKLPKKITLETLKKVFKDNGYKIIGEYTANTGSQYITVETDSETLDEIRISIRDHERHSADYVRPDYDLLVEYDNSWQDRFEDIINILNLKGAFVTKVKKYNELSRKLRGEKQYFSVELVAEKIKGQPSDLLDLYNIRLKKASPVRSAESSSYATDKMPYTSNITPSGRDVNSPRYQTETEEKNLVVYHKISKDSLNKAIDLGGMPVPSLAIVKKDTDFVGFGGITLVGNKDMVNPQNAKNKVYNRDVWSTTFPEDEYKKVTQKAKDTFTKKFGKFFDETDSKNDLSSLLYTAERAYPGSAINEFQYLL